ncbi:pentatricopeptide repeat-containing protein [Quercus suber]|uniref:Pentatricopeptide repeat-containing protein n=1 Tax=Quercus suber TaxID=58331 RepID=A0AAW0MEI7_QUESU
MLMRSVIRPNDFRFAGFLNASDHVAEDLGQASSWLHDTVSWTSLIVGNAQNGQPSEALNFFELPLKSSSQHDHVTFVEFDNVLEDFHLIKEKGGLKHITDRFACTTENIINQMPMKPDKILWASTWWFFLYALATAYMWGQVAKVRNAIDDIGMVKKPGYHSEMLAVAFGIISTPPETITIKLLTV